MAKRQSWYTLTLVEVTYDVDEWRDLGADAGEQMVRGYHLRAHRSVTSRRSHILMGRRETRTTLLVDVPAEERFAARALFETSVRQANARDGGERYLTLDYQRGRVIREPRGATAATAATAKATKATKGTAAA